MKKNLILSFALCCGVSLNAQFKDIGSFLANGPQDAQMLLQGYLAPYFNAFGASLTGGWYNTAKPHKLGGFDLTFSFNTAIVPEIDRNFDVSELGLTSLQLADPAQNMAPTIAGKKELGPTLNFNTPYPQLNGKAFDMPKGVGVPAMSSPMLQLGIGFIKDTEINGRYMPTYSPRLLKETNIGMWGLGFKHGIKQYIPGIKKVPVFHLTLQYGFTKLDASVGMNVKPENIGANDQSGNAWDNQKLEFTTMSHTGNLLASANFPVVCFYGGIGFASTKTDFALKGDYPMLDKTELTAPTVTANSVISDPISLEFKNSDGSAVKPRLNIGMRIKLGIITFHGDYTYANYSLVSGGVGISFR